jgi:hypothetical protein
MCRAMKHSSKFAFPQTRLPHTITLSALDDFNKHQQFIETLAKETHIMRTLSSFTSWYKVLMTHKYRGCIIVLSINKSVEPNEEQKVLTSVFDQGFTINTSKRVFRGIW